MQGINRNYVLGFCNERRKCNKRQASALMRMPSGCYSDFRGHEQAICAPNHNEDLVDLRASEPLVAG